MLIPVILSGGAGSRLWPVSREGYPKPFMKLADGESLLLKTYRRAAAVTKNKGALLTVTNRDFYFMSKDEMSLLKNDCVQFEFLLEPVGRNTTPAVTMAARILEARYGRDAVMLVLPADHLIQDEEKFANAVFEAQKLAEEGKLVTFGVVPKNPETGFGYIEAGALLNQYSTGRRVERFVEKPSFEKAKEYLNSGRFLWNSGMFCFKVGVFLEEIKSQASDINSAIDVCWNEISKDSNIATVGHVIEIPLQNFIQVPEISIDYALMERSPNVAVVPVDFGWSDIGSWVAMQELTKADECGNRAELNRAIFVDSFNTYVRSEDRLVATVGINNLMIIDTPDALLVADPSKAQEVKHVVAQLKKSGNETYKFHRTVFRPWGSYTVLGEGNRFKLKRIEVKPGGSLSLQMHHHRNEHWIVVSGIAKVVNGNDVFFVRANESTYIPAGSKHRLENPGVLELIMIEVQSGDYLGEDDIVRFEDNYGRV